MCLCLSLQNVCICAKICVYVLDVFSKKCVRVRVYKVFVAECVCVCVYVKCVCEVCICVCVLEDKANH